MGWFSASSDPLKTRDQNDMRLIAAGLNGSNGTSDQQSAIARQLMGGGLYDQQIGAAAGRMGDLAQQIASGDDTGAIAAETTGTMRQMLGQLAGRGVGLGSGAAGGALSTLMAQSLMRRSQMGLQRQSAAAQLYGQQAGVYGQADQLRNQRMQAAAGIYQGIDQADINRKLGAGQLLGNTGPTPKTNGALLGEGFGNLITSLAGPFATVLTGGIKL